MPLLSLLGLAACGGGSAGGGSGAPPPPAPLTIGGSVSSLNGTLILQQNGANNLTVAANGAFVFAGSIPSGSSYSVTILAQPSGQKCAVASGSGTASANVTNVSISCVNLYTIGGSVTGLTAGAVVLQNNAGDDLTISANGTFTFAGAIEGGSAYSVSVLTQPPGPDCSLTSGSGTATGNVANVSVVCTPAPSTTFLPLAPPALEPGGVELSVATSKSIARPPTLITNNFVSAVGFRLPVSRASSGYQNTGKATALVYVGAGAPESHLYALDLTASSSLTPRQLSTLTFPFSSNPPYCESWQGFADIDDPDSAFWILKPLGTDGTCQQATSFLRIRLTDTAAAAPEVLSQLSAGTKHLLYHPDGTFAGLLNVDAATHRLVMHRGDSLSTPVALLTDCVNFRVFEPPSIAEGFTRLTADPSYAFLEVSMWDGSKKLYRVDHTGAISSVLHGVNFQLSASAAFDASYFYFLDRPTPSSTQQQLLRARLDGTAPAQLLYTTAANDPELYIVGVSGAKLVLQHSLYVDPVSGQKTSYIKVLDTSGPGTPAILATFDAWLSRVFLVKDRLFLSVTRQLPDPPLRFAYETYILGNDGAVLQPKLPGSQFIGTAADAVQRVRDVATFGLRSGSVESISVQPDGTLSASGLKRVDGSVFTLSATASFGDSFGPKATGLGMGSWADEEGNFPFLLDGARGTIEPVDAAGFLFVRMF